MSDHPTSPPAPALRPLPSARDSWLDLRLGDLGSLRRGISYSGDTLSDRGGVPYVNLKSFLKGGGFSERGMKRYTGRFASHDLITNRHVLIANTDLTPGGDVIGSPAILPSEFWNVQVVSSHHVSRLEIPDWIDPAYLCALLMLPHCRQAMRSISAGTTVLNLNKRQFHGIVLPCAPLTEQRRIVAILNTLDEAIRQTERVIAKLRRMKQGLLHDLLTRGLDANGQLRDPQRHPEQFKDSPLGRMPKEWEVLSMRQLMVGPGEYGAGAAALPYMPDMPRYVRITDITNDGRLDPRSRASIRPEEAAPYLLREGDLLFARSGATVGKTYLYHEGDGACAHAGYVIKFSVDPAVACPEFLFFWTLSPMYWRWIGRTLRQGAQPNINASEYALHKVPAVPLAEQRAITARLSASDDRLRDERETLAKLRTLKHGLMDDLLTGRVRVSAPEEVHA